MPNDDTIYIRSRNRYAGSRSRFGKIPPTANRPKTRVHLSDTVFNIGQVYYAQTATFREAYYAQEHAIKGDLTEFLKAISPFIAERNKEIAKAKASNPKKWWTPKWLYFGDLCGTCGAIKQGKNCPLYLEH